MPNKCRDSFILADVNGYPAWAAGYTVVVCKAGGVVSAASSGNVIALHTGHGLQAGDKFFRLSPGSAPSELRTVATSTATQITMSGGSVLSVAFGDILINLDADTGVSEPNYDNPGTTVYSDPAGTYTINNSVVATDAYGNYRYWVDDTTDVWELFRDTLGVPQGVEIVDAT